MITKKLLLNHLNIDAKVMYHKAEETCITGYYNGMTGQTILTQIYQVPCDRILFVKFPFQRQFSLDIDYCLKHNLYILSRTQEAVCF